MGVACSIVRLERDGLCGVGYRVRPNVSNMTECITHDHVALSISAISLKF